ncbi:MAG: HIT domain-containing protein [Candidatus Omnitrophica bacterium]|nr:HIT domain-containing protein [Candidatus Omnitrophota bacterium]
MWAPWRSRFIYQRRPPGCIFCGGRRSGRREASRLIIRRSRHAFALLNLYPYTNGHLMVAPVRHVKEPRLLTASEWADLWSLLLDSQRLLDRVLHPHGYNIGINLGRAAGAGIPGHLHVHLVPRWEGDTNFMPIVGRTKVISEGLQALYRKLLKAQR